MVKNLFLFINIFVFCFLPSASADDNFEIKALIGQKEVGFNEKLKISIFTSSPIDEKEIDLSLFSTNFRVDNIKSNDEKKRFFISLYPKNKGVIKIPKIRIRNKYTKEKTIRVINKLKSKKDSLLRLESKISQKTGFVHTYFEYELKIYDGVGIIKGQTFIPSSEEYFMIKLSKGDEYSKEEINGKIYNIVKAKYAIIPKVVGEILIEPIVFKGQLKGVSGGVEIKSNKVFIKSLAPPVKQESNWFPANKIEILDSWAGKKVDFEEGEVTKRTVRIVSYGQVKPFLPKKVSFSESYFRNFITAKRYKTEVKNKKIISFVEFDISSVPKKSGELFTPEVVLDWWNNKNKQFETLSYGRKKVFVEKAQESKTNKKDNEFLLDKDLKAFLRTNKKRAKIGEKITLKLTLFDAKEMYSAVIKPPSNAGYIIKKIGVAKSSSKFINNKKYLVTNWEYALFPTGSYKENKDLDVFIKPFSVYLSDKQNKDNTEVMSNPIHIKIDKKPKEFVFKDWFSATDVKLFTGFLPKNVEQIKLGDVIKQTIVIKAIDTNENMIPKISYPKINGANVYLGKQEESHEIKGDNYIAKREQTFIIRPFAKNKIYIPKIDINWWNYKTEKLEKSSIPEKTIILYQEPEKLKKSLEENYLKDLETRLNDLPKWLEEILQKPPLENVYKKHKIFIWSYWRVIIGALIVGIVVFLRIYQHLVIYFAKKNLWDNKDLKILENILKESCDKNKPKDALKALITWGKAFFKNKKITNASDIAKIIKDEEFEEKTKELNSFVYANIEGAWNGKEFFKSFNKAKDKAKKDRNFKFFKKKQDLPNLYS